MQEIITVQERNLSAEKTKGASSQIKSSLRFETLQEISKMVGNKIH